MPDDTPRALVVELGGDVQGRSRTELVEHGPPGFYMLFIVDTTGVPSVAQFVRLR